jgi:outer membrane biosynthesis protein TonB
MEESLKESISEHIELIKNLSSLSNVQLITFVNVLSVNNSEMFNILKEVTEWESKVLSEFMKESEQADEKKKEEPQKESEQADEKKKEEPQKESKKKPQKEPKKESKKKPQKELKRASDDMFEQSQYDRVQIGGEQKEQK